MKLEDILRYIVIWGTFAVVFTPVIVASPFFFPYITGKGFFFRALALIIFGAWALLAASDASWRPRKGLLLYAALSFLVVVGMADIFSENPYKSFWSNFERMEGYITLIHLFLYFLVAGVVFGRERLGLRFFDLSVGVSAGIAFLGLFSAWGSPGTHARLDIMFGNATYAAGYMLVHVFMALFLAYRKRRLRGVWSWYYPAAIFLQAAALFYTGTRGALIALLGVSAFLAAGLLIVEKQEKSGRKIAWGALIGLMLLVTMFLAVKDASWVRGNGILNRFATISVENAAPRLALWQIAWEGVKERPLLGWGQESFNFVFNKHYRPEISGQEQWFDRTHNIFLDWLVSAGALGLASYIFLFVAVFWLLWRNGSGSFSRSEKLLLSGLVGAYIIHNLFVFDNIASYIFFFSLLAFIHAEGSAKSGPVPGSSGVMTRLYRNYALAPWVGVALAAVLYMSIAPNVRAAYFIMRGLASAAQDAAAALSYYERALQERTFARQEVREQLQLTAIGIIRQPGIPLDLKNRFATLAAEEMAREIDAQPGDARLSAFQAAFLSAAGQHRGAAIFYDKALQLSPGKQALLLDASAAYIAAGEVQKGFEMAEAVYRSKPDDLDMQRRYVIAAASAGKDDVIAEIYGRWPKEYRADYRVLEAYHTAGRYEKAAEIGEMITYYWPENAEYHLFLAAPYAALGRREEAKIEIRKAIELSPARRTRGEQLIRDIDQGKL